jgi:predicted MFS family arabinose efflux permease
MLGRALDASYPRAVREGVTLLTAARLTANSAYRFAPPFLATIARDTGVSLTTLGVALSVSEFGGVLSPMLGRMVDRWPRRRTMALGLLGVATSTFAVAASPSIIWFSIALLGIAVSKTVFDISLGGWIADHVSYERRGRVVGLTEISWAGGLLVGVPIMGLVAGITSWRGGYIVAGLAVLVLAGLVSKRLEESPHPAPPAPVATVAAVAAAGPTGGADLSTPSRRRRRLNSRLLAVIVSFGCLMGAAQCAFVTFGSWLEDDFGATAGGLAAASFGLGVVELIASTSSVRLTDQWGKRRSVASGAALMVPTGIIMIGPGQGSLPIGLALLGLYILGFEFAVVSALSLASNLVPGRASTGIGFLFGAGTLGRAATNVLATKLYEGSGVGAAFLLGAALATACVISLLAGTARQPARLAPATSRS